MPLPKRRGYRHYDTKSQTSILSFWSRSALLSLQESNYRHRRAEPKRLKFPCYLFELRADFYLLWAALFTCTALSAQTRKMVGWAGSRPLYSYIGSSPFFSGWRPHCMPQNKRGYPPHRGRACNSRRPCRESGKRNETPWLRPHIPPVFPPQWSRAAHLRPPSHSPQAALGVLIPLSTTVTSG